MTGQSGTAEDQNIEETWIAPPPPPTHPSGEARGGATESLSHGVRAKPQTVPQNRRCAFWAWGTDQPLRFWVESLHVMLSSRR